jgi:hypothetical protein
MNSAHFINEGDALQFLTGGPELFRHNTYCFVVGNSLSESSQIPLVGCKAMLGTSVHKVKKNSAQINFGSDPNANQKNINFVVMCA